MGCGGRGLGVELFVGGFLEATFTALVALAPDWSGSFTHVPTTRAYCACLCNWPQPPQREVRHRLRPTTQPGNGLERAVGSQRGGAGLLSYPPRCLRKMPPGSPRLDADASGFTGTTWSPSPSTWSPSFGGRGRRGVLPALEAHLAGVDDEALRCIAHVVEGVAGDEG